MTNKIRSTKLLLIAVCLVTLIGCQSTATHQVLDTDSKSQLQLRSIQSRAFDTRDRNFMLRTVIATMQDLGFVVDQADETLGTVSGTRLIHNQQLKMTVSLRPKGEKQLMVRANAQYGLRPVEDPLSYQDFFTSLSKGLYLDAHEVG